MKKLLSILLAFSLVFCSITYCFAIDTTTYKLDNGVLTISGKGSCTRTWKCNKSITKVIVEEGITSLATYAFLQCENLVEVQLPESLTSMGTDIFSSCKNLTTINIPSNLTEIPSCAFIDCYSLASITFPEGITKIGDTAFRNTAISEVSFPSTLTTIDGSAFYSCNNLTTVYIPGNVKTVGDKVFYRSENLTEITFDEGVETIGNRITYRCDKLQTMNLPSTLKSIGNDINDTTITINFNGTAEQLSKVNFGNNTQKVNALKLSSASVKYEGNYSSTISFSVDTDGLLTIKGSGIMENKDLFSLPEYTNYKEEITKIKIDDNITVIGDFAFYNLTNVKSVETKATTIGNYSFYGCSNLETISNTINTIGNFGFFGCTNLTTDLSNTTQGANALDLEGNQQLAFKSSKDRLTATIDYLKTVYLTNDSLAFDIDYCSTEDIEILQALSDYITAGCSSDIEKVNAIYTWVKANIKGSYENTGYSAIDVFRNRAAVCSGFAQLTSALCKLSGIRATIARGYKEDTTYVNLEFNNLKGERYLHEWVLAYVNNNWQLVDALWDNNTSDVDYMATWYYLLEVDGITAYTDAIDLTCTDCRSTKVFYKDGNYIGLIKGATVKNRISARYNQVGGCLKYTTFFNKAKAITGGWYTGSSLYNIKDNSILTQGEVVNYENTLYLLNGESSIKINESIANNGLTQNKLNMYIGEEIDLSEHYSNSSITTSDNTVLITSGSSIVALSEGSAKVFIDSSKVCEINVYGDIIKSNELFQELCDHDCSHCVLGKDYCDYCGKELVNEPIIEPISYTPEQPQELVSEPQTQEPSIVKENVPDQTSQPGATDDNEPIIETTKEGNLTVVVLCFNQEDLDKLDEATLAKLILKALNR